ncbi:kynureninase [Agreia bicolorata]|uniref:Kynureninase n=1 Tax=Agreia bicolorata TaxID=110935 RepID=A0ABR5CJ06_9MICO|nr:kynureninase [Agreia bicolorata]KJC65629.1 kynureninase [Agreia bicolorata]
MASLAQAEELDAHDPLRSKRDLFVGSDDPGIVAYLDGNSLGRPLRASAARLAEFVPAAWGARLIRGWDEEWFDLPLTLGDRIGAVTLGAAPGQVAVGDSTTVLLYKLIRAAVDARPGRREIVVDTDNFPTDRYLVEAIAAERNLVVRWIESDTRGGVTAPELEAVLGDDTALVLLSHVAYRSGFLADVPALTRIAHAAGALVLWDVCHSVASVPMDLDGWGVDIAVGCTYKYLNGGPGSPAFVYVRRELQESLVQPIQGWMGHAAPFDMGPGYSPAPGMRRFLSGTPSIVGMQALRDMVDLVDEVGMPAVRAKSETLTRFAIDAVDGWPASWAVDVATPRQAERRGSHVTIEHPAFKQITAELWRRGVIPDFRAPQGMRLGLSPLSTSHVELWNGLEAVREQLVRL